MIKIQLIFLQLIFMLLTASTLMAAKTADTDYEALTLRLYYEQKWDSLLVVGEEAISQGHDYFYMRVRVGEAAFHKQRYVRATRHLEKALEFNSRDEYAIGLLYKAYHYSNHTDDARWMLRKLPSDQARNLGRADRRPLLYLEAGPAFSDHVSQYEKNRQKGPGLYSEVYLNRNSQYLLAGIYNPLGYRFGINAAFAAINFNKTRQINSPYVDSLSGNYSVTQFEAYLSPSFNLTHRIKISPAFRLVNVSVENALKSDDTLMQKFIGPSNNLNYNDYAYGGEISYSAPYWTASAGAWALQIDQLKITQISGTFFLKPLGNLNLYASTTISLKSSQTQNDYIFSQMIGGKIYQKLWGEAFMSWGDLSGSADQNIQIIYNAFDKIKSRAGTRLIFNFNDYFGLSLRYQVFFRKGTELFFPFDQPGRIISYNYINQSITGGITWNLH